uniref:NADH-ubiquinone oxidoreductase chain 3 n=1 Tax=Aegilops tauschii subsp. strangulata TaxID=200361 RepID=A0A453JEP6_AEGTS
RADAFGGQIWAANASARTRRGRDLGLGRRVGPPLLSAPTQTDAGGRNGSVGGAWVQFRICYYMFALVFVVFDVKTVFLYPWAMSFDVLTLV